MTDSLAASLRRSAEAIEKELDRLLPPIESEPAIIHQAMRYSVMGGGKRLRAFLTLCAAQLRGGEAQLALPVAAAIEMIHAYSLIHDDLPCMDDDDFRRGKPSNHKVFGEGMAVLAGDALLSHAFAVLADLPRLSGLTAAVTLRICQTITAAVGTAGLIGGQVADLQQETRALPADAGTLLLWIHTRKTGALFSAAMCSGALAGGLEEADLAAVSAFAHHFGLAFQITDDILDIVGDPAKLGKPAGSDDRQQKLTYPRVYGLERSRCMAQDAAESAIAAVASYGSAAEALIDLACYVVNRDH